MFETFLLVWGIVAGCIALVGEWGGDGDGLGAMLLDAARETEATGGE